MITVPKYLWGQGPHLDYLPCGPCGTYVPYGCAHWKPVPLTNAQRQVRKRKRAAAGKPALPPRMDPEEYRERRNAARREKRKAGPTGGDPCRRWRPAELGAGGAYGDRHVCLLPKGHEGEHRTDRGAHWTGRQPVRMERA